MKKILLPLLMLFALVAKSQVDLGIQFNPSLSINRVFNDIEGYNLSNDGTAVTFTAGPIVDLYLADNIAVSSGVWYTNKKSSLSYGTGTLEYSLHYIQIPATIKMFTNNITNDMRLYFQLGGTIDIKTTEKGLNQETKDLIKKKKFAKLYDAGILISAGVEYNIGTSNKIYGGIIYNRGLVNIYTDEMKNVIKDSAKDLTLVYEGEIDSSKMFYKNDILSLVLGFKF